MNHETHHPLAGEGNGRAQGTKEKSMESMPKEDQCKIDESSRERFRREIPGIVDQLVLSCEGSDCFEHVSPEPIPSRESIITLIEKVRKILFPGYFISTPVDRINLGYYFGQEVT